MRSPKTTRAQKKNDSLGGAGRKERPAMEAKQLKGAGELGSSGDGAAQGGTERWSSSDYWRQRKGCEPSGGRWSPMAEEMELPRMQRKKPLVALFGETARNSSSG